MKITEEELECCGEKWTQITGRVDVQGLSLDPSKEWLLFDPGPSRCGNIEDGVSIALGVFEGWWVIDFKDLEEMYNMAVEARKNDV